MNHKTVTVEIAIGDLAEVKAAVEQLQRDKVELLETLANSPHTVATWFNDARHEFREGWAGSLAADPGDDCRAGHFCCDGHLVSRRVMEMLVEYERSSPGYFVIDNESTVTRADVEAIGFEQGRVVPTFTEADFREKFGDT